MNTHRRSLVISGIPVVVCLQVVVSFTCMAQGFDDIGGPIRQGPNFRGNGGIIAGPGIPGFDGGPVTSGPTTLVSTVGNNITSGGPLGNLGGFGGPFGSLLSGGAGSQGAFQNLAFISTLLALFQNGANTQRSAAIAMGNLGAAEARTRGDNPTRPASPSGGGSPGSGVSNPPPGQGSAGNKKPNNGNGSTSGSGTSGNTGGSSTVGTSGGGPAGGGSTVGSGGPNGGAGGSGSPGSSGGATGTLGAVGSGNKPESGSNSDQSQGNGNNNAQGSKPTSPFSGTIGMAGAPSTNSTGGGGSLPTGSFFPRGYTNGGM